MLITSKWQKQVGLSACKIEGSSGVLTETFAPDWSSHNHHRSSYLDQVFDVDPEEDVDE